MDKETTELMDRTKDIEIQVNIYTCVRKPEEVTSFRLVMKVPRSLSRKETVKNIHDAIKSRFNATDFSYKCVCSSCMERNK